METKAILSHYKTVKDNVGGKISIYDFISGVKDGRWQDGVLSVRNAKNDEEKANLKKKLEAATISGVFEKRSISGLRNHSGFIAIDLDDIDNPNSEKKLIEKDPYIYAAFVSVSGKGLCLILKIDGTRHEDAFKGIDQYLYESYGMVVDKSGSDVSRLRIVSYDPYIHINEDAVLFKKYPPKPKVKKNPPPVAFVDSDFGNIVKSLYDRGINLCETYGDWLRVCFAIVSEYGNTSEGLEYFDTLSKLGSKYNAQDCEKQYKVCLASHSESKSKKTDIQYIYEKASMYGIETYSEETKEVVRATSSQHKNGVGKKDIIKSLEKYNNIPESFSSGIIDQVIEKGIEHKSENIIDDIIYFLRPYGLKKNLITRNVEINGKPINDDDINTLFIDCKSVFDKATKDLVCSVIFSNKTEQYNPLMDFFNNPNEEVDKECPNLKLLINSVITDTPDYEKWITKWLVSICASAHGEYSPLVLVFSGRKQGTGKTYWMRYLLPKKLRYLFGESDMDNGKDDEILMTKKLIILDDEYGGKSKREEKKLKKITAKEFINVREPYGRVSVDLRRIAVFAGTTNEEQILSDPTGNRRVLPINIISLDHGKYNLCDKEMLWHEINHLYKSGYDFTVLESEIEALYANTENFVMSSPEEDLITEKLSKGSSNLGEWMSITMIIDNIALNSTHKLSNTKVGQILTKIGYEKKRMYLNGNTVTAFYVNVVNKNTHPSGDLPPF